MAEAAGFFAKSFQSPGTIEGVIALVGERPLAEAMATARKEQLGAKASQKSWAVQVKNQMRNLQRYTTGATQTRVPKDMRAIIEAVGEKKAQEVKGEQILEKGITVTRYEGDEFRYDGIHLDNPPYRDIHRTAVYIPGSQLEAFVEQMRAGEHAKASDEFNEAYFEAYQLSGAYMQQVTRLEWRLGE